VTPRALLLWVTIFYTYQSYRRTWRWSYWRPPKCQQYSLSSTRWYNPQRLLVVVWNSVDWL